MPIRKASLVYFILSTVGSFVLSVRAPVAALYRIKSVGLDAFHLIVVGVVLELAVIVAEIPTGAIADLCGRRRSAAFGYMLMAVGFWIEASIPRFAFVLLGQILFGVGYTFTSGAVTAWIAQEAGQQEFERLVMRRLQFAAAGSVAGLAAAFVLGKVSFVYPLYVSAAASLALSGFLLVAMPEAKFRRRGASIKDDWAGFLALLQDALRFTVTNARMRNVVIASFLLGAMSEPVDRLWELHLIGKFALSNDTSVTLFVAIQVAALAVSALAAEHARRASAFRSPHRTGAYLAAVTGAITVGLLVFSSAKHLALAALAFVMIGGLRTLLAPAFAAWTNELIADDVRATVFSIQSQSDASGQVLGGLAFGKLAAIFGVPAALSAAAAMLLPLQLLYRRTK